MIEPTFLIRRVAFALFTVCCVCLVAVELHGQAPRAAAEIELQPLSAQVKRLGEALDYLGVPFSAAEQRALQAAMANPDAAAATAAIQEVLDPRCLLNVEINPEMRVKAAAGPAKADLVEQGWRVFLVRVRNQSGTTAELRAVSPNAQSVHNAPGRDTASDKFYRGKANPGTGNTEADRWLDLEMYLQQPLKKELSGLALEYRILSLYSRDAGKREAKLVFNVGQGTQDLGFRSEVDILFRCLPARKLTFDVKDENGKPTTATFVFRDAEHRVYPSQAKRLAPDFAFHPQVYRADGETMRLPEGEYSVEVTRGPEYLAKQQTLSVRKDGQVIKASLERWIDPSKLGWWSGDHHIHAAGCAHYTVPSEGVLASDMYRHCQGEDLKIGCNLTWGPCFDFQKQFFTGKDDKVSQYPYLLHYDIEVSGFGSHQSGHLVLLRLKDEMYPGGASDKHWPTLCLNTLRWAKQQGAICGPAHSGWGLEVSTSELPNYVVPPFNGIGANEYIMDVTQEVPGPDGALVPAVDFMSTVDTPSVWELNLWYHTLNVGYRTRISGETDFPCIYGERVGLGRSYVRLGEHLDYGQWCEGLRQGRNYVSDGRSHLIDFAVNGAVMGEGKSELALGAPGTVKARVKVAALLNETPNPAIKNRPYADKPYWDIERARLGTSREVPVELIVNGYPVAKKTVMADGVMRDVEFEVRIEQSSWVAVRVLPSSHSNPVFVMVAGKPIRASARSARWCLEGVEKCWAEKKKFIKADELVGAQAAYDSAREIYRKRLAECGGE